MSILRSFLSQNKDKPDTGEKVAGSGKKKQTTGIQSWCLNTYEYRKLEGVEMTRESCEDEMKNDVSDILAKKESYISKVNDEYILNLEKFDNRSNVPKQGVQDSFVDDPRWTVELHSRVKRELLSSGMRVSADIQQTQSFRAIVDNEKFGEISSVFGFSGHA